MRATLDVLKEARALIADKGWCQGVYARNANGNATDLHGRHAAAFCAEGAMFCAAGEGFAENALSFFADAIPSGYRRGYLSWNDEPGRTKEEVLAAFDRAIARAEAP